MGLDPARLGPCEGALSHPATLALHVVCCAASAYGVWVSQVMTSQTYPAVQARSAAVAALKGTGWTVRDLADWWQCDRATIYACMRRADPASVQQITENARKEIECLGSR